MESFMGWMDVFSFSISAMKSNGFEAGLFKLDKQEGPRVLIGSAFRRAPNDETFLSFLWATDLLVFFAKLIVDSSCPSVGPELELFFGRKNSACFSRNRSWLPALFETFGLDALHSPLPSGWG